MLSVHEKGHDRIGRERVGIVRDVPVVPNGVSVVPLEPVHRPEPDKTAAVPYHARSHAVGGKAVRCREAIEMVDGKESVLCHEALCAPEKQQQNQETGVYSEAVVTDGLNGAIAGGRAGHGKPPRACMIPTARGTNRTIENSTGGEQCQFSRQ